jgi:hypothetical protein
LVKKRIRTFLKAFIESKMRRRGPPQVLKWHPVNDLTRAHSYFFHWYEYDQIPKKMFSCFYTCMYHELDFIDWSLAG